MRGGVAEATPALLCAAFVANTCDCCIFFMTLVYEYMHLVCCGFVGYVCFVTFADDVMWVSGLICCFIVSRSHGLVAGACMRGTVSVVLASHRMYSHISFPLCTVSDQCVVGLW